MITMMNRAWGWLTPLALLFLLAGAGCSDNEDLILGPADDEHEEGEEVFAWLWAYDASADSLRVYDADSGNLAAVFFARPHGVLHEILSGPEGEPTVWMGSQGQGYGFTAGYGTHGDHAHMELPEVLATVTTGSGNAHQGTDFHGDTVVWANDGDSSFSLVNTTDQTVMTLDHGSPHSNALLAHEHLLATHMNEKWARLIDVETNTIINEVAIDTLAHGDAFHHDSETGFISCLNGVEVMDLETGNRLGSINYPATGRCNFLFHGGDSDFVLGPVKFAEGNADHLFLLDMANQTMSAVEIPGSALAWNRGGGNIALAGNGSLAVMTDLESPQAYIVGLGPASAGMVETLDVEAADMAAALNHDGDALWLLEKGTGEVHFFHLHEGHYEEGGHLEVHPDSDWIFITSLDGNISLIRDY